MADTPVPDADPADVEEQHRPVVDEPDGAPDDPPVRDADLEADPADAQEQAQVVDDDDEDRR